MALSVSWSFFKQGGEGQGGVGWTALNIYIYIDIIYTFTLTFYLILFLAYTLTLYLTFFLAFYMASVLSYFLANNILIFFLAFCLTFSLAWVRVQAPSTAFGARHMARIRSCPQTRRAGRGRRRRWRRWGRWGWRRRRRRRRSCTFVKI